MINELRLGNWVKWSTMPIQIVNETIAYRTYLKSNENRVKPIQITHEVASWISVCAVNRFDTGWLGVIDLTDEDNPFHFIQIEFEEGDLDVVVSIWLLEPEHEHHAKFKLPHIQHLHQLQNLYYSLTGKELVINQP
jgi:hypothetical protein